MNSWYLDISSSNEKRIVSMFLLPRPEAGKVHLLKLPSANAYLTWSRAIPCIAGTIVLAWHSLQGIQPMCPLKTLKRKTELANCQMSWDIVPLHPLLKFSFSTTCLPERMSPWPGTAKAILFPLSPISMIQLWYFKNKWIYVIMYKFLDASAK